MWDWLQRTTEEKMRTKIVEACPHRMLLQCGDVDIDNAGGWRLCHGDERSAAGNDS
jgi:hypothetical protein